MSDHSENSSSSGEWERVSESSGETEKHLKDERIANLEEELRRMTEEMKKTKEENECLKSKIGENEALSTLYKWMKEEIEEIRSSNAKLSTKTMEVYKVICEKGEAKLQNTSSSERKRMTKEAQNLEDLCKKLSKDLKKFNEKCIREITTNLKKVTVKEKLNDEETRSINRFVGEYVAREKNIWTRIALKKVKKTEHYKMSFTNEDGSVVTQTWIPDNVERAGWKAWIEGDDLHVNKDDVLNIYELGDSGFEWSGNLYDRV